MLIYLFQPELLTHKSKLFANEVREIMCRLNKIFVNWSCF